MDHMIMAEYNPAFGSSSNILKGLSYVYTIMN